ncbi:TetR/AcrR family transcriptional regulator [Alicyclobacillus sp. SO9]|uniref:TetR/AcrR family transcriptional regulator n=1 Tax=Alicyclobacillus sp. SO9 TaxID=2665646 RepID=UPI0018E9015D|nr:TetR/AcrR family transcriptional regulator [Alicyclobacillus sp. SO9]QQE76875.1 TetR family transcriptional regulator [Alicyclobacillus sp. SO9]
MNKNRPKEELFQVAGRLFSQKGYHGTTIREIASAHGILSGSLYAHISSKEDLLFYLVDDGAETFLSALKPILRQEGDALTKIRDGLAAHIRVVTTQMDIAKVFLHDWTALREERRKLIQEKRDVYENLWSTLLNEGIEQMRIATEDAKYLRILLLSAGNWVYEWYSPEGELSPEEIADKFIQIVFHGVAVSKEKLPRLEQ